MGSRVQGAAGSTTGHDYVAQLVRASHEVIISQHPATDANPRPSFPGDPSALPVAQFMSASSFTTYPYSRGHIHITGPHATDPLDFHTGFFTDPHGVDVKSSMWAYKKQREILRRMAVYGG